MEKNQPNTGKIGWTYGLIGGVISIVFTLMLYFMDMMAEAATNIGIQLVGLAVLIGVIVIGILQFKKINEGFITLSQALKIGAAIALINGIISLAFTYLLTQVIDPALGVSLLEVGKQQALQQYPQMTDEQWEQGLAVQKVVSYAFGIILPVIIGLVIGLVTGLIVKKQRPE
ncbi:DUF4199 domain-containing protein [Cellulophaga sp. F20128]|uniref:DUF4199 domain-containing protein n=1 Tax=Cellulophaga sp. F20128 TaxID=2926413 RepID=UPI001FF515C1|nr:DUF4199 domain-containing protein [Cellulophaga sp. F20128]MCK0156939.1 DUF4199 domain-containing protein [Cellulophaga sp. F20128]